MVSRLVVLGSECPRTLLTVTSSIWFVMSTDATVWRKAWGLMCGRPCRLLNLSSHVVQVSGWTGSPLSCVKTYPKSFQRSPFLKRSSACSARSCFNRVITSRGILELLCSPVFVVPSYGDDLLHGGDPLTRAQLVTTIYRLLDDEFSS